MRVALLLALALLVTPGCIEDSDSGSDEGAEQDDLPQVVPTAVPADIVFTGNLVGMGDVSANAPVSCPLGEAQCIDHVVDVPAGNWTVTFTLVGADGTVTSQGVPYGTDYDLFVDGVGESIQPAGTPDVVSARLEAGSYTAQVLAWHDVDGSYTLTVSFAA